MSCIEKKKIEKKEQINAAAVKVIAHKGYHDATMQDIATEAGLAVGTLYNYFSNKADLILSIFYEKWEEFQIGMKNYIKDIEDFEELSQRRFKYLMNFFIQHPDYIRILFAQMTNFIVIEEDLREKLIEIKEMVVNEAAVHLELGRVKKYYSFKGDAKVLAHVILGILQSFLVNTIVFAKEIQEEDVNALYSFMQNGLMQNMKIKRIQL